MSNALAKFKAAPKKGECPAILMTRCGCERVAAVPIPPPQTVTVELAPLQHDAPKEERVFHLAAQGSHPKVKGPVYLYQEGGVREKSRIIVP